MKSKEEIFAELYDMVCEEHLTYPFHRSSERTSLAIQKSVFEAMERYAIEKQIEVLEEVEVKINTSKSDDIALSKIIDYLELKLTKLKSL